MKIKETKIIGLQEVSEEVKKIIQRDEEQGLEKNFRLNKTTEYLKDFLTLTKKQMQELHKEIEDLKIPRLKEEHIIKIIDTLPQTQEEVSLLFAGQIITISQDNVKKIAETTKKYKKQK